MALEGSRVAVIGGGLGGLTAARELSSFGADVEVLEAEPRAGGVLHTSEREGFRCEHAANGAMSGAADGLVELARELGVEVLSASPAARHRWIYTGGKLRVLPSDPRSLITTDLLSPAAKLRLLAEPLRPPLRGDVTVAEFFRHRLGAEVHDRVVAPFVTGIFAGDTERLSLAAAFPRLAELATHGSLLRGLIASRRGGQRGPGRIAAPAGGMGEVIDALARDLGNRIRLETPVAAVARVAGGVEVTLASGVRDVYDAAVIAAPAAAAARLVSDADGELAELLAGVETAPVAVVHLGYDRAAIDHPLDGFGFLVEAAEPLPILGAVFESQLWPGRAPDGAVLLRAMIGGARRPELVERDGAELIELAREALSAVLGIRGEPILASAVKWPAAIPQYTVGHLQRVERADHLASEQSVVLAGASYRGVAVNAICADASRVVRSVAQILAAPLALLLMLSGFGCSGAGVNKQTPGRDGGDTPAAVERSIDNDGDYQIAGGELGGSVAVSVVLDDPPAAWVTSPGADACGHTRRRPLAIDTFGGVRDAAVWIEGIEAGAPPPESVRGRAVLADCALSPPVLALPRTGATLEVAAATERRVELALSRGDEAIARLPMVPIGRVFAVELEAAGVYEIAGDGIDSSWAVVSRSPYLGVTDTRGRFRFTRVPDGKFRIRAWHPPVVPGGDPLSATAEVEVSGGEPASVEVSLR